MERGRVSLKAFTRMTKFSKGEEDFQDWNFDFAVALCSECPALLHNLKVVETMPEEMTTRSVYDLDVDRADRMGLDKLSRKAVRSVSHDHRRRRQNDDSQRARSGWDLGLAPAVPPLQSENVGPSFADPS